MPNKSKSSGLQRWDEPESTPQHVADTFSERRAWLRERPVDKRRQSHNCLAPVTSSPLNWMSCLRARKTAWR
eukprot:8920183-Alexandrium_andersonii.AAC.1